MSEIPTIGPAAGNRGKGRKKGVPNKVTSTAKEAIALAAENLGGAERLTAWARADVLNERAFWATIYPKLLPLQLTGEGGGALQITLVKYAEEHSPSE